MGSPWTCVEQRGQRPGNSIIARTVSPERAGPEGWLRPFRASVSGASWFPGRCAGLSSPSPSGRRTTEQNWDELDGRVPGNSHLPARVLTAPGSPVLADPGPDGPRRVAAMGMDKLDRYEYKNARAGSVTASYESQYSVLNGSRLRWADGSK